MCGAGAGRGGAVSGCHNGDMHPAQTRRLSVQLHARLNRCLHAHATVHSAYFLGGEILASSPPLHEAIHIGRVIASWNRLVWNSQGVNRFFCGFLLAKTSSSYPCSGSSKPVWIEGMVFACLHGVVSTVSTTTKFESLITQQTQPFFDF
jgi:hypothetical protein